MRSVLVSTLFFITNADICEISRESSIRSKWRCARAVASFHDARTMRSRSEMLNLLVYNFDFLYTEPEWFDEYGDHDINEICGDIGIEPELFDTALFFNYDPYNPDDNYFIDECEDEADSEGGRLVRDVYKFIRESGWSVVADPLDAECWAIYPTDRLYTDHVLREGEKPFSF